MFRSLPVPQMNKTMLLDLLNQHKVKTITGIKVQEITDEGVITGKGSGRQLIPAYTIVLAAGLKPDNRLFQSLIGKFVSLYALGDCQQPRNIMGAIWDGYEVGRAV